MGRLAASAIPLAMFMPTTNEPANPGPRVTAIASMASNPAWAAESASETTAKIDSMCCREAASGKTPPYWACSALWEATILERIKRPFSTTAAAVSSQEVSMPNMRVSSEGMFDYLAPDHRKQVSLCDRIHKHFHFQCLGSRNLEHQVFRVLGQRLEPAVRPGPDGVLDPNP